MNLTDKKEITYMLSQTTLEGVKINNVQYYSLEQIKIEVERVKELFRTNVDAYGKPKQIMKTLDSIVNNLKTK